MDLQLTQEQSWLSESADGIVAAVTADGIVPPAASGELWQSLVEFGALQIGEDGIGAVELSLVARSLGQRLAPIPYVDTAAVLYGLADRAPLSPAQISVAPCLSEPGRGFAPLEPSTTLTDERLDGEKTDVLFGDRVDLLAVTASEPAGLALVFVPPTAAGVTVLPASTLDARAPADDGAPRGRDLLA